jgi:hypothetical protein
MIDPPTEVLLKLSPNAFQAGAVECESQRTHAKPIRHGRLKHTDKSGLPEGVLRDLNALRRAIVLVQEVQHLLLSRISLRQC